MTSRLGYLLMVLWVTVSAVSGADSFADANRQLAAGKFQEAASAYKHLIATEGPDAAVFYNLGNCHQRLKQYGPAILAYEQARLLSPRDPDLLANLALARKAATAFEASNRNPRLEAIIGYLSRDEWSWLVAGCALALGALVMVAGLVKLPRGWIRHVAVASAVTAILTIAVGATVLFLRRTEETRGIVLTENAAIRLSPFKAAEPVGTTGAGHTVHLGKRSGDFRYAEVAGTGLRGWIADEDAQVICK